MKNNGVQDHGVQDHGVQNKDVQDNGGTDDGRMLSLQEAAELCGMPEEEMLRLLEAGAIPGAYQVAEQPQSAWVNLVGGLGGDGLDDGDAVGIDPEKWAMVLAAVAGLIEETTQLEVGLNEAMARIRELTADYVDLEKLTKGNRVLLSELLMNPAVGRQGGPIRRSLHDLRESTGNRVRMRLLKWLMDGPGGRYDIVEFDEEDMPFGS